MTAIPAEFSRDEIDALRANLVEAEAQAFALADEICTTISTETASTFGGMVDSYLATRKRIRGLRRALKVAVAG